MHLHRWLIALGMVIYLGALTARAETDAPPYARVLLTILSADGSSEALFGDTLPPGGSRVRLHVDANTACTVLVLPLLEKENRLANGWRPQLVEMNEWDEKRLPLAPTAWNWAPTVGSCAFYVVFFPPNDPALNDLGRLVTLMQKPDADERLLTLQTAKLRELLGPRLSAPSQELIVRASPQELATIGGVVRGESDFPWRKVARKIPLNANREGFVILRHGGGH